MVIIIPKIPSTVTVDVLSEFVENALVKFWFFTYGDITKIDIVAQCDTRTGMAEYHGLVYLSSEEACQVVISRLNRKKLLARPVVVREYVVRSWQNDRRSNHVIGMDNPSFGNRVGDRRRTAYLEKLDPAYSMYATSNDIFSRKML